VNLSSVYSEIKQLLSISDKCFDLEKIINSNFKPESDENKLEILGDILNFVNRFSIFQEIKPFMNSLYTCITRTLEIKPDSIYDIEPLLIRNAIMYFVQEHINYSKISQKDQVLKVLTESFEKLETQPLIMNLGLLIKPIYQDQEYLTQLYGNKEVQVTYQMNNNTEIQIKSEIDAWLKFQDVNLEKHEELKKRLLNELEMLLLKYNFSHNIEKSKKLQMEVLEMLTLRLTMASLMEHVPDDSFEPISIK